MIHVKKSCPHFMPSLSLSHTRTYSHIHTLFLTLSFSWPQIVLLFPQLLWDPFCVSLIRASQLSFSPSSPFSFYSNTHTDTHRHTHTHTVSYMQSCSLSILLPWSLVPSIIKQQWEGGVVCCCRCVKVCIGPCMCMPKAHISVSPQQKWIETLHEESN